MNKVVSTKILIGLMIIFISTLFILFFVKRTDSIIVNLEPSPNYRQKIKSNDSKIVIYEFSDFSCPACQKIHFYLKDVVEYFPYISINFRHYPLTTIHPYAFKASIWAECAGIKYSKFWEFADILFLERQKWSNNPDYEKLFEEYSKRISMDVSVIKECVKKSDAIELVKKDMKEGDRIGVDSTPTFFVNGKKAVGGLELVERLKEVIR